MFSQRSRCQMWQNLNRIYQEEINASLRTVKGYNSSKPSATDSLSIVFTKGELFFYGLEPLKVDFGFLPQFLI